MLIGWINVYELPNLLSVISRICVGILALLLFGYHAASYLQSARDVSLQRRNELESPSGLKPDTLKSSRRQEASR